MGETRPPDQPRDARSAGPAELGWVRWGITFGGLGLAVGGYDLATDKEAGWRDRVSMAIVGLGGLGFALSMWVPPFARAFGWVLHKLR